MDGPPLHEQARRPECTAPRYINDVTAAEIYESRVGDRHKQPPPAPPPPPKLHASWDCFEARAGASTKRERDPVHGLRHADCVPANAPGNADLLEIGSLVDKRWETDTTRRIRPACSLSTQGGILRIAFQPVYHLIAVICAIVEPNVDFHVCLWKFIFNTLVTKMWLCTTIFVRYTQVIRSLELDVRILIQGGHWKIKGFEKVITCSFSIFFFL